VGGTTASRSWKFTKCRKHPRNLVPSVFITVPCSSNLGSCQIWSDRPDKSRRCASALNVSCDPSARKRSFSSATALLAASPDLCRWIAAGAAVLVGLLLTPRYRAGSCGDTLRHSPAGGSTSSIWEWGPAARSSRSRFCRARSARALFTDRSTNCSGSVVHQTRASQSSVLTRRNFSSPSPPAELPVRDRVSTRPFTGILRVLQSPLGVGARRLSRRW
jgi:hypothetical protein